jgi:hypothetical protein
MMFSSPRGLDRKAGARSTQRDPRNSALAAGLKPIVFVCIQM